MSECPCEKLTSGEATYVCPLKGWRMTPGHCRLYIQRPAYRERWDRVGGPGQGGPPPPVRKLPPLRDQAIGFMKHFAKWAGDCFRCVGQEEFDRRVAICMDCKFFIRKRGRCSKCGCFGKLKALAKVWKCPEEKW